MGTKVTEVAPTVEETNMRPVSTESEVEEFQLR